MTNWLYSKTIVAKSPVVLTDHYLKEASTRGADDIVIQGVIARETLENIGYDAYQRELGTQRQRQKLFDALEQGKPLTSVELGMRGSRTRDRGGNLILNDPVYAIDGRQRIGTLLEWMAAHPEDQKAFIACTVHLNTDLEWEKKRFNELNLGQRPVSPSKIFANDRNTSTGLAAIYGLCNADKGFALYDRVCWDQNMNREHLMTARNLLIVANHLHSHLVPSRSYTVESIELALERIVKSFGVQTLRDNLRDFFEIVDECWGVRSVKYRQGTIHIKGGFLMSLARVFSDHYDFWGSNNRRLSVSAKDRARLRALILDENVARLTEGGSKTRAGLRWHMIQAVNYKRHGKIKERQDTRAQDREVDIEAA